MYVHGSIVRNMEKPDEFCVVVLGSGGVGKSALTIRFTQGDFVEDYNPTIEDSYRRQVDVDGTVGLLEILDTAGQEEFSAMQDQWMVDGDGFLVVYAINNRQSFEDVAPFRDKIMRCKENDAIPVILVGNKCDLGDEREVDEQEGEELAKSWGAAFVETSAKTMINADEPFIDAVRRSCSCAQYSRSSGTTRS